MTKKLKALLLSAGLGTRLRPLTNNTPKCLVEINNTPIIEYWLKNLEKINCSETLVNTHYLYEKVNNYLAKRVKNKMLIKTTFEQKLCGTAGTLLKNRKFFNNSKIIMIHADNMTKFNLQDLIDADKERPKNCLMTMLTFNSDNPENCGIITRNKEMILQDFFEKKKNPPTNIANAAIYVFDNELIEFLFNKYRNITDFSTQVIPLLINKIYTFHTDETYIDIGTEKNLIKAKNIFKNYK